jgi:hypothetical protein
VSGPAKGCRVRGAAQRVRCARSPHTNTRTHTPGLCPAAGRCARWAPYAAAPEFSRESELCPAAGRCAGAEDPARFGQIPAILAVCAEARDAQREDDARARLSRPRPRARGRARAPLAPRAAHGPGVSPNEQKHGAGDAAQWPRGRRSRRGTPPGPARRPPRAWRRVQPPPPAGAAPRRAAPLARQRRRKRIDDRRFRRALPERARCFAPPSGRPPRPITRPAPEERAGKRDRARSRDASLIGA